MLGARLSRLAPVVQGADAPDLDHLRFSRPVFRRRRRRRGVRLGRRFSL
jgi:hypothetical protein